MGDNDTFVIRTVNMWDHAKREIQAARGEDVDPWTIAKNHLTLATIITTILEDEDEDED